MTAVVWVLFGLMVAILGVLATAVFSALSRVDDLRADVNAQFGAMRGEFTGRFDGLHEDMRELRGAVANLDRRLTTAGG